MMKRVTNLFIGLLGLFLLVDTNRTCNADNVLSTSQLIRRAYLEYLQIPPTPAELEWYIVYNKNQSLIKAAEWVAQHASKDADVQSIIYTNITSPTFTSNATPLEQWQINNIIYYQSGCYQSLYDAKVRLIKNGIAYSDDTLDVIDYIYENLTAKTTNTSVANMYLQVFKKYNNEIDGYLAVLEHIKNSTDCCMK